ncbi:hypothetical protein XENORESO_016181, partial [Xenotaenia resolanae]
SPEVLFTNCLQDRRSDLLGDLQVDASLNPSPMSALSLFCRTESQSHAILPLVNTTASCRLTVYDDIPQLSLFTFEKHFTNDLFNSYTLHVFSIPPPIIHRERSRGVCHHLLCSEGSDAGVYVLLLCGRQQMEERGQSKETCVPDSQRNLEGPEFADDNITKTAPVILTTPTLISTYIPTLFQSSPQLLFSASPPPSQITRIWLYISSSKILH